MPPITADGDRRFESFISQGRIDDRQRVGAGIDAYAHRAAIEAGGRTIAFLGSSVTNVYPRSIMRWPMN